MPAPQLNQLYGNNINSPPTSSSSSNLGMNRSHSYHSGFTTYEQPGYSHQSQNTKKTYTEAYSFRNRSSHPIQNSSGQKLTMKQHTDNNNNNIAEGLHNLSNSMLKSNQIQPNIDTHNISCGSNNLTRYSFLFLSWLMNYVVIYFKINDQYFN
jgi:hypothetical protein